MSDVFRLACCQLKVEKEKEKNLSKARLMIAEAVENGAQMVVLPEMFNCPYRAELFPEYAESYPGGPSLEMLSLTAKENSVYIVGGSIPERENGCLYNTSFVFDPDGRLLGRHRKAHLFDVDLPGGLKIRESNTLNSGNQSTVIRTELCSIGVAICYDIRFPELIRQMVLKGAQVVIIPATFTFTTGQVHWKITFQVRAIDNQVFTVGAAAARDYSERFIGYAHSLICDPWGEVLAEAGEEEEIIYSEINLQRLEKVRQELPLLRRLRKDLY